VMTQEDLAEITGRQSSINQRLSQRKASSLADIASELSAAFGTTAQFWMIIWRLHIDCLWGAATPDETVSPLKPGSMQKRPSKKWSSVDGLRSQKA